MTAQILGAGDLAADKVCSRCGERRPVADFYRSSSAWDRRFAWCKVCKRTYDQDRASGRLATWAPKKWEPRQAISVTDAAYLAGIIDGEGSIVAHHHKSSGAWMLIVTIANTDVRLIDWLDERWHATQHSQPPRKPGQKPCWNWTVTNRRVIPVLEAALPYLVIKREQAELALTWVAVQRNHGRRGYPPEVRAQREEIMRQIRALNRKGTADEQRDHRPDLPSGADRGSRVPGEEQ